MTSTTIQALIGRNVRTIRNRHGLTQEAVGKATRGRGLRWNTSRIGELERGLLGVSLAAAIALAQSLRDLTGEPTKLSELLDGDDDVDVFLHTYEASALRDVLAGGTIEALQEAMQRPLDAETSHLLGELRQTQSRIRVVEAALHEARQEMRERGWDDGRNDPANRRAAKKLGVSDEETAELAHHLFSRSLSQERDRIAGQSASTQRLGLVTRDLIFAMQIELDQRG